jgi:hypothetical protein
MANDHFGTLCTDLRMENALLLSDRTQGAMAARNGRIERLY